MSKIIFYMSGYYFSVKTLEAIEVTKETKNQYKGVKAHDPSYERTFRKADPFLFEDFDEAVEKMDEHLTEHKNHLLNQVDAINQRLARLEGLGVEGLKKEPL